MSASIEISNSTVAQIHTKLQVYQLIPIKEVVMRSFFQFTYRIDLTIALSIEHTDHHPTSFWFEVGICIIFECVH